MAEQKSLLKDFLSGGAGGIALVAAGHPFDLIKVRMQTMKVLPGQAPPFTGALDCATKTFKAEGVKGLYRGMAAPLTGVTPIFAVCFWAYGVGKKWMTELRGLKHERDLSLVDLGIAGAFSAVPTTAIMAPGERIKCLLQIQTAGSAKYAGPMDVVRTLARTEGVMSLFRGSAATLLRDGTGSFAYFAVYEGIKRALTPEGTALSPLAVVLGGGFAGVCNWVVALPFDVIKSRIQTAETKRGIVETARELVREEGVKGLFRGSGPAILRAFPANAACFGGVELSLWLMNKVF